MACCDNGLRPGRAFSSVYKALPIQTAYNALSIPSFSLGKTLGGIFRRPCERELADTSCPHEVQLLHLQQLHVVRATKVVQLWHVTRKALIGYLKVKNNDRFYCISHVE